MGGTRAERGWGKAKLHVDRGRSGQKVEGERTEASEASMHFVVRSYLSGVETDEKYCSSDALQGMGNGRGTS